MTLFAVPSSVELLVGAAQGDNMCKVNSMLWYQGEITVEVEVTGGEGRSLVVRGGHWW
jgi:hypothetical protein